MISQTAVFVTLGALFLIAGLLIRKPLARITGTLGAFLFLGLGIITIFLGEMSQWSSGVLWTFAIVVGLLWLLYTRWYLKKAMNTDPGLIETERKAIPGSILGGVLFLIVGLAGEIIHNDTLRVFWLLAIINFFGALWYSWNIKALQKGKRI